MANPGEPLHDIAHPGAVELLTPEPNQSLRFFRDVLNHAPCEIACSRLKNLPSRYPAIGVGVRRIDHLALLCNDVAANRRFAQTLLGMQLREQVVSNDGATEIGSWLSPSPVHHQIATSSTPSAATLGFITSRSGSMSTRTCRRRRTSCPRPASSSRSSRRSTTTPRVSTCLCMSRAATGWRSVPGLRAGFRGRALE